MITLTGLIFKGLLVAGVLDRPGRIGLVWHSIPAQPTPRLGAQAYAALINRAPKHWRVRVRRRYNKKGLVAFQSHGWVTVLQGPGVEGTGNYFCNFSFVRQSFPKDVL